MRQLSMLTDNERTGAQDAALFRDADRMRAKYPSLFATHASPKMSSKYSFTNTYDIVLAMHNRGYRVRTIMGGQHSFSKVMVRMNIGSLQNEDAPELLIIDSHDGSSRIRTRLGWIRAICMNGMIVGASLYDRAYTHTIDDIMARVLLDLDDVDEHAKKVRGVVAQMQHYIPTHVQRRILTDAVIDARFDRERDEAFRVSMGNALQVTRREEDEGLDLYTTMNVIQENALRGGFRYRVGRQRRTMQSVASVDRNIDVNVALWEAATKLMAA